MTDYPHRVQVESVAWLEAMPGLRLFRSFRQSLAPSRVFLALLLVVVIFLGGKALDVIVGGRVYNNEVRNYQVLSAAEYDRFMRNSAEDYRAAVAAGKTVEREPIFQTLLDFQLTHFNRMVDGVVSLNFGLSELIGGQWLAGGGVLGELRQMLVTAPRWLWRSHRVFALCYLVYAFLLTMILGGAIARLAALDACRGLHASPFVALRFSLRKAGSFIAAPLLPLAVAIGIGLVLAVISGVLFNFPVLDVVGGLLFFLLLLLGAAAAVFLVALAVGFNLFAPAIAVEDADAFDAVSRSFSYIIAHPWRYVVYLAAALVHGAIGYLFVAFMLFATLWVTKMFAALLVFTHAGGVSRFDAIMPDPVLGQLTLQPQLDTLSAPGKAAALLVNVWTKLLLAVLPAFCVSFYFTSLTWVYLLLRFRADGAPFDEIALDVPPDAHTQAPDKVEPAA